jgi:gamma-glutamyltranspeptidase/glutathione hydrolase
MLARVRNPEGHPMRRALIGLLAMSFSTAASVGLNQSAYGQAGGGDRITGAPFSTRAPVIAQHGMAATAQPLATMVAIDILKKGGSAVDAAIAANAALGLMEPTGNGIGGDLYAIVWDPKTGKLYGLNASGRAPLGRSYDQLKAKLGDRTSIPRFGSLSVSVPGAVDGWFELHAKFGKLPMADVLAPAIGYAKDGFPVSEIVAYYWDRNMTRLGELAGKPGSEIEEFANARATYTPGGKAPAQGDIFRNADLARTYELLAAGGRDTFYKGPIAQTIDAYMKRIGGDLRAEDLAAHTSTWEDPACVAYRDGVSVCGLGPNTQGYATLQMLSILKNFDLKAMGAGSPQALHVMIEAKRLAYEDIARYYADPAFTKVPVKWLLSDEYGAERAKLIDPAKAMAMAYPGEAPAQSDTTYLTVADKDGMMVSLIQSNFRGMGSGLVPDGLGFMFQNRAELFALQPGHPNVYAPGKRPFQTIIPAFALKDGKPWLSFGVMGGDMQPQGQAQVLINMVDFGMNVQEAGDAARWRHEGSSETTGEPAQGTGTVHVEGGIAPETRAGLTAMGHTLGESDGSFGGYQAIMRDANGTYWGASEMRKDGAAMGY